MRKPLRDGSRELGRFFIDLGVHFAIHFAIHFPKILGYMGAKLPKIIVKMADGVSFEEGSEDEIDEIP